MRKFKLTNPNFNGHILFAFDMDGHLSGYSNESEMTKAQVHYVLCRFPLSIDQLPKLTDGNSARLEELPPDLSFEAFWALPPPRNKINKKRCQTLWAGLNDAHKTAAISQYPFYIASCNSSGRWLADPENYLKKELYLTDWRAKK